MGRQVVQSMVATLIKELITAAADIPVCKGLLKTKFERWWVEKLVEPHKPELANKIARPVDHTREAAFNPFIVGQFFATVNILYERLGMNCAEQVANLDKSGYTPGRELCRGYRRCVVNSCTG